VVGGAFSTLLCSSPAYRLNPHPHTFSPLQPEQTLFTYPPGSPKGIGGGDCFHPCASHQGVCTWVPPSEPEPSPPQCCRHGCTNTGAQTDAQRDRLPWGLWCTRGLDGKTGLSGRGGDSERSGNLSGTHLTVLTQTYGSDRSGPPTLELPLLV